MPYGYNGKILHVDLNHGKLEVEEPAEAFYRKYMGGSAMGMYYILRDMPPGTDALAPDMVLTLMASVTTGTPISGQSRVNANAKSPVSGAIGDSQSGGFFPAELKFAGFDGIVVKGRSSKPVYLSILNGEVKLHDAATWWARLPAKWMPCCARRWASRKPRCCSMARRPRMACCSPAWYRWPIAIMGAPAWGW